jgi:hypothetical protein
MLSNRKSQHGARTRKVKSKCGNIMTELSAFNKFKFLEILRIQAPYKKMYVETLIIVKNQPTSP